MRAETIVSIYAAIIGTCAFFLNLKNWWDSGPRLTLRLIPDGVVIGGGPSFDERDIVIVSAINRGSAATVITGLHVFEMPTLKSRWRRKPTRCFLIPNPQLKGYPSNVPSELGPAKMWTGAIRKRADIIPDLHTGTFCAAIYASHRDKPYLKRIPKMVAKKEAAKDTL
jgi:hypothetical protein